MTHVFLTVIGAALTVATLPLVLELFLVTVANLILPDRQERTPVPVPEATNYLSGEESGKLNQTEAQAIDSRLAIIVPAHNEEFLVGRTVTSLRASAGTGANILVIAHNCSDQTASRAAEAGAEALIYNDPSAVGKGFALRYGFAHALKGGARAVMVVDSDSVVSVNTIGAVLTAFERGAKVIQCRYEMQSTTEKSSTRLAALAFRAFNVIRPRGRSRLGLSAGIVGNGFAIDRTVLESVPYDAFSVVEDLEYHLHLVMAGQRVRYLGEALISADFPESKTGESVQRSRWEGGRLMTARVWAIPILGKILGGRPRLIEPLLDLTGLPMAFGAFLLLVALCLPLLWLRLYAVASLGIIMLHVLAAAWAGPDFLKTLQLLALSPLYILRKLWMIPGVLRGSSAKAAWVRTERDNTL